MRTVASGQLLALQDLQEKLNRQGWQALEAEREASQLRAQLAAAQASDESAQQDVKEAWAAAGWKPSCRCTEQARAGYTGTV